MTHDEFMANPYGVPTGSVPRPRNGTYLKSEPMADLNRKAWHCKHGVTPEHCADCSELGVEQAPSMADYLPGGRVKVNGTQVGGTFYKDMTIEPWAACESWMTPEQFQGHLLASAIQYLSRFNVKEEGKGGLKDVRKAHHYLAKLIEVMDADS